MYKPKALFYIFILLISNSVFGQDSTKPLVVDQSAFNLVPDTIVQNRLLESLNGFLKEKNKGSLNNKYIDPAYLKENIEPFQHFQDIEMNGGAPFYFPTLLRVIPIEESGLLIKIAYMGVSLANNTPYLRIIGTLIAKRNGSGYYFYNALDHYTKSWNRLTLGSVNYVYPNKINLKKAKAMDQFNISFAKKLNTRVLKVKYYKFEDPEMMFKSMGYDFIENMYLSRVGGLAQYWNNTVFAGNDSEQYEHEVVHFYTYIVFPKGTKNVHEGYATYIGGSSGKSLKELVPLAKKYIDAHPEQDITELATDFYPHTPDVQLTYVLSGLVCRDIDRRQGMSGVKRLFTPAEGDDYFVNLKKVIGIDKKDFGQYIRELLMKN
ncbi:MAG TPA: hypothetical protein VK541_21180 [Pedobacter sp.]|uniref:hypothetical protein n=1 Tax=Pedobacter sp. TaxID=1411316 RepID=UPI002BC72DF2|nr:hypothetical protein [Pedobacter sp.]HMI05013.1 hypothetical protein [Pedobacter sp.]